MSKKSRFKFEVPHKRKKEIEIFLKSNKCHQISISPNKNGDYFFMFSLKSSNEQENIINGLRKMNLKPEEI